LSIHNPKRGSASYVSARRWAPEFEVSVKYGWGHHLRRGVFVDKGDQQMRTNKTSMELERISEALVLCGYTSLDEQAKALGLGRSTAWTITKNKHKLGRLSAKTIDEFCPIHRRHLLFVSLLEYIRSHGTNGSPVIFPR
jgi:hypothetical protein